MRLRLAVLTSVVACGGGGGTVVPDAPAPIAACVIPAGGTAVDTSVSTNVVGSGSAAGCTEDALRAAVTAGGTVRFACGSDAVVITVVAPIVVNSTAGDVVIDGGSNVTLDGRNHTRLLEADTSLTLQNIALAHGLDTGSDGGGAILRRGGTLTVIDSVITSSNCRQPGPDIAGGAIRLLGATPALIVGSSIKGNACSNGGGIGGSQATPVVIVNTSILNNTATGSGGDGGNAGGLYFAGSGLDVELCGVSLAGNHGAAYGGGLYISDDAGSGTVSIENSEITNNDIAEAVGVASQGGGAYLVGASVAMTNVTLAGNSAAYAAGLDLERGTLAATNVTFSDHLGTALTAGSGAAGNLTACTFGGNFRALAGASDFMMQTTALGSNNIGCDVAPRDGGGNVQFPDATCGGSVPMMDPQLGALADNGGTTGVRTRAPAAGSPAIGAGKVCPAVDARGLPRPATACTSGAHEVN
jgi:hypothetical protein